MMIPEFLARFIEALSGADALADGFFFGENVLGSSENFGFVLARNHDDAIRIAAQNVSRSDARVADIDDHIGAFELHAIFSRTHGIAAAEDGIAELEAESRIAASAIDHRAGDAAAMGDLGEDIAPDGGVFASAIINRDDRAGRDVVNEVADGASRLADRTVQQREGASGEAKARIARFDAKALSGDAEAVERVAYVGGVELAGAFNGAIGIGQENFLNGGVQRRSIFS